MLFSNFEISLIVDINYTIQGKYPRSIAKVDS